MFVICCYLFVLSINYYLLVILFYCLLFAASYVCYC